MEEIESFFVKVDEHKLTLYEAVILVRVILAREIARKAGRE